MRKASIKNVARGQLSFFLENGLLRQFDAVPLKKSFSDCNYLLTGERILSLAKEQYEKYLFETDPLEKIWKLKFRYERKSYMDKDLLGDLRKIGDVLVRPILNSLTDNEYLAYPMIYSDQDPYGKDLYDESMPIWHNIRNLTGCSVRTMSNEVQVVNQINDLINGSGVKVIGIQKEPLYSVYRQFRIKKKDTVLRVRYVLDGSDKVYCVYGSQHENHPSARVSCVFKKSYVVGADLGVFFSILFIMKVVKERISLITASKDPGTDIIYADAERFYYSNRTFYRDGKRGYYNDREFLQKMASCFASYRGEHPLEKRWIAGRDLYRWEIVKRFLESVEISAIEVDRRTSDIPLRPSYLYHGSSDNAVVTRDAWKTLYSNYGLRGVFDGIFEMPTITDLTRYGCSNEFCDKVHELPAMPFVHGMSLFVLFYFDPFLAIAEENARKNEERATARRDYSKAVSRATPYMTKKNIPAKTIEAMEESDFNSFFSYVEFDSDTDLEKVQLIAKEFSAVYKQCFPFVDSKNNSIRFRALGNYKASGLYWPFFSCMCVDYRHVDSFLHEFGHLIDYSYGRLSDKPGFSAIIDAYKTYIEQKMKNDEAFSARMKGKTKYNLSYFLTATEIFARSFELYLFFRKGVKNSLLKTQKQYEELPEYPTDDNVYVEAVNCYFDSFFSAEDKVISENMQKRA